MLIAGGDTSGQLLGGFINLSTSTNSTNAAEIYNAVADTFTNTGGALNDSREASTTAVPLTINAGLRQNQTLTAGGSFCHPQSYNAGGTGGAGVGGPACGTSTFTGFQCDALNSAELYSEGGGGSFALTPNMNAFRSGATATVIMNTGTAMDGQVLVTGGSVGSTFLGLSGLNAAPPGCGVGGQVAQNTAELYNPMTNTWTATTPITGCSAGTQPAAPWVANHMYVLNQTATDSNGNLETVSTAGTSGATQPTWMTTFGAMTTDNTVVWTNGGPACVSGGLPAICPNNVLTPITSASQTGTTITVNDTTNPAGLMVNYGVTLQGLSPANMNGLFIVSSIGTGTFTATSKTSQTVTASGTGVSGADTFQCGLVDSSAALLGNGDVLVAGGDYFQFLGSSSQQAFIYTPANQTWTVVPPMNVPRELAAITTLPSGRVLVAGGLFGASGACAEQGASGMISVTTNQTAEIFNPLVSPPTWTLTGNNMLVKRIATAELFTTGSATGLAILAGGVDAEDGIPTNNPPMCAPITSLVQTAQTATDLFEETANANAGAFTATGALHQAREGYASAFLNGNAKFANDLILFGGACTNTGSGLSSYVIGSASSSSCTPTAPTSNYYEFFSPGATPLGSPSSGTWTLGTGGVPTTPANAPAYTLLP